MTEAEKAVYDEEDPEIPADLFSLWAKAEFTDDEDAGDVEEPAERAESAGQEQIAEAPAELNELAGDVPESVATAEHVEFADNASEAEATAENADDESSESTEPTLDEAEMAYLTSADDSAAASTEQEAVSESANGVTEAETTAEIADDETSETTEPTLDETEIAYLTSANDAAASAEQETVSDPADDVVESAGIVNDDLEAEATADADGEASELSEPTLDESEIAYLTGANVVAVASAEQEAVSESADDVAESAEVADDAPEIEATAENVEFADNVSEAEATAEIADDESSESTEPMLDEAEMAYLTSADNAAASAEQETELPAAVPSADAVAESAEVAGASSDVTDDDLDDLIDVPILPLPAESTEVTDDDLAFIRAPILSPGDPVSMPSIPVQADPTVPPAELSSPSIVEIVQEQEAIESLGNLTAPKVTDPLALFKKLRDLAEELPHNVYYAFKASRMCATLDEIIADFEA
ncbi:MAG: hypothetical protein HDR38_00445 [Treponema sp.]|nr:hypothetical protein [Treponema sp.]